jgi:hypothetical protein
VHSNRPGSGGSTATEPAASSSHQQQLSDAEASFVSPGSSCNLLLQHQLAQQAAAADGAATAGLAGGQAACLQQPEAGMLTMQSLLQHGLHCQQQQQQHDEEDQQSPHARVFADILLSLSGTSGWQ